MSGSARKCRIRQVEGKTEFRPQDKAVPLFSPKFGKELGNVMKRNFGSTTIVLIGFALYVGSIATAHAQQCSVATVAGKFGFTATGSLLPPSGPVLIAAVGNTTIKLDGTLSGTEARNVGGGFANETLTGTWSVNRDCTGTLTAEVFQAGVLVRTSVLSLVFDGNGRELRAVQQSLTLPDGTTLPAVITFEASKAIGSDDLN
jgi:hypothetical protein